MVEKILRRKGKRQWERGVAQWQTTTIGKALKLKSGNFLSAAKMAKEGIYPVYGGNGITGHHSEYMFEGSKVVIGRVGANCGAIHLTKPFLWITDNALYVVEKRVKIIDEYLELFLRNANLNQYPSQVGQPLISENRLRDVSLKLPPLDEQRRIANIAMRADRLRRTRCYAQQLSDTYLQSVFLEMFGDPVSNPKGWEKVKAGKIFEIQLGKMLSKKSKTGKNPFPYLANLNVQWGSFELSELRQMDFTTKEFEKFHLKKVIF